MIWIVLLSVCFLAYSNGANDNFKGVASLFGSGVTTYRRALAWATLTTATGALSALALGQALAAKFSGRGLVPDSLAAAPEFAASVAAGAGLTVIFATLTGFPISTTHALTGAIMGVGLAAPGGNLSLGALGKGFVLPLLFSPALAIGASLAADRLFAVMRVRQGALAAAAQVLSAGTVCLARGLNDAPKIAAMLFAARAVAPSQGFALVSAAMAIGGLVHSRRIADTVSLRITPLVPTEGLAANVSTAVIVLAASAAGLPVSTTHVSVGSIFGIGLASGRGDRSVMKAILGSWLLTLPCGAVLAYVLYWMLRSQQ